MVDLAGPGITVSAMAIAGAAAWMIRATRTSSDVKAVDRSLEVVKSEHARRLDGHDDDIRRITQDFVPRHELDAKLQLTLDPINRQLEHQRSLLEYAVLGKRPEAPTIFVDR